jgi:tetratricopeptide (TPR) repeat protein
MIRAIAIVVVMWSSAALAQPASAQAEALFRQGRDLMAAGRVAEACSAFDESQKLEPEVTTLLNVAACREKLGQFATAWGLFLDAARQTRSASDAATQQLHNVAQAHAEKLESRVSKLTINVPQRSQVDGLEIARGTERVSAGLWNRALPIDGGTYTITARAPGANQWSTQITVAAESDTRTIEIPDLRNLPRDLDKPGAPSPPGRHGARWFRSLSERARSRYSVAGSASSSGPSPNTTWRSPRR